MTADHEDRFVLFVRFDQAEPSVPGVEQPLASCASYQEARLLRRQLQGSNGECVIRYIGHTGGGD
jgi:hypothetical protein